MRVSILQMHVTIGDRNRNYSRLKRMMEEAMRGVGENSRTACRGKCHGRKS